MHGCKRIEKAHSLNSFMSIDNHKWTLKIREYSCFCGSCIDKDYQECINQTHGYTGAWISVPLDVTNTVDTDDNFFDYIPWL